MNRPSSVYNQTLLRLKKIFSSFDNIYISFSGGKDSSVLLNLCIDYIRKNRLKCRLDVFHMDYEIQYRETIDYVDQVLNSNQDILDVYRICVPFKVPTCTSMFQQYWRPWDEDMRDQWVRQQPKDCYTQKDFPFFKSNMWDYEFQLRFAEWIHLRNRAKRTCCLIGIRTQESFNRWRTIHSKRNYYHQGLKWIHLIKTNIYCAYPIYDWLTTDIWTANGKFGWSYNHLYDLFYQAGIPLDKQRVASPFISQAQSSLKLYRAIDPDMWGKMINRVNGVNFTGIYGGTSAVGWKKVTLPKGFTWAQYMQFLLSTLPSETRANYLRKLSVSIEFWRTRGGCLSTKTIEKLRNAGIEISVGETTAYKTNKKPVRMEYRDDINIAEFRELPTFKRICICILKNDHACKYMGFALNKDEKKRKKRIMDIYKSLL